MSDKDFVVVLGAGPGLGGAVARAFAETGARVVMLARNPDRLEELATQIRSQTGAEVGYVPVDVTDEAALRAAFAQIRGQYGDPTVLIHNPSIAHEAPPTQTPLDTLLAGVRLAAGSLLVASQEVVPAMRTTGGGTILVTGNQAAVTGSTWSAGLAAQKAAVRNLTLSLAAELEPDGIHVTVITIDGLLDTPGLERDRIAAEYVRLHQQPTTGWTPETTWPPR